MKDLIEGKSLACFNKAFLPPQWPLMNDQANRSYSP